MNKRLQIEFFLFLGVGLLLASTITLFVYRHSQNLEFSIISGEGIALFFIFGFFYYMMVIPLLRVIKIIHEKEKIPADKSVSILHLPHKIAEAAQESWKMIADMKKERILLEKEKQEFEAVLKHMAEGVIIVNADRKIVLMNESFYKMVEVRSGETVGQIYWEVIRNPEISQAIKEAFSQNKPVRKMIAVYNEDESFFDMQVSQVFLKNGILSGIIAVFHNVTTLKKMERMRSEFAANVSHELKTPLTSIKGFAETLQEGAIEDKEAAHRFLHIISTQSQRLENLVNDILTLSAIESKNFSLNLTNISPRRFFEEILPFFQKAIQKKEHHVELRIPEDIAVVKADRRMIEQLFTNLIDNAIKFTPQGGEITITAEENGLYLCVDIIDTGIGIAKPHLPRLFERFYRVDKSRSRELGGTGLGLAIVKHIAQAHGGWVEVSSEPGQGSKFSVFLPKNDKHAS